MPPPRSTREASASESSGLALSSTQCQTLPAMSFKPKPLGGYCPTGVVRRGGLSPQSLQLALPYALPLPQG